jgi:hypothetical protein
MTYLKGRGPGTLVRTAAAQLSTACRIDGEKSASDCLPKPNRMFFHSCLVVLGLDDAPPYDLGSLRSRFANSGAACYLLTGYNGVGQLAHKFGERTVRSVNLDN